MSAVTTPLAGASTDRCRQTCTYAVFVLLPAAAVVLMLRGASSGAASAAAPGGAGHRTYAKPDTLNVLLAVLAVVVAAQAVGGVARRLGQPAVVGEIAAGLLLGPSVLGALMPGPQATLFPPGVVAQLDMLAQFGVVFFMFLVGADLRLSLLRGQGGAALVLGHSGIAVPFLFGVLLGMGPLDRYRPPAVAPLSFTMFCGVAFSVTAFPVLARILAGRRLSDTRIGALGLATAGVSDLTAWCVLAFVVAVVREGSPGDVVRTVLLSLGFCALMWLVVRPLLRRLTTSIGSRRVTSMLLLGNVLLAASATEAIGIGSIFGAFLAGVASPRETPAVVHFTRRLAAPAQWLLLPMFFAVVGLRTDVHALGSDGAVLLLIIATGVVGKLIGTAVPGLLVGLRVSRAAALGVMMNCRGLTEIVILQTGLSLGVLSPELFAAFLVMALVTTAMTGPLLGRVTGRDPADPAESGPAAASTEAAPAVPAPPSAGTPERRRSAS